MNLFILYALVVVWFFSWYCTQLCSYVCVRACVLAVAVIEQTRELLFYSKPLHDLFPTWLGTRGKIAQLGEHSITIIDVHLLQRFVCIQDGEINITFHALHCFFCILCLYPIAQRAWSGGREGGGGEGCNSLLSKGIDTLKYGLGKVSKTMRRVKILIARLRSI